MSLDKLLAKELDADNTSSNRKTISSLEDAKEAIIKVKEILEHHPTQTEFNKIKDQIGIGTRAGNFKRQTGHTFGEVKEKVQNRKKDIRERYGEQYDIVNIRRKRGGYEVDLNCLNCGKEYTVTMSRVRAGQKMFCSTSCSGKYDSDLILDNNRILSYLGGVYVGDGHVGRYENETLFRLNTVDEIFRDKVKDKLEQLNLNTYCFSQKPKKKNHRKLYCVRVRSVPFCDYLETNFSKDNCITNALSVKTDIMERQFICGFYESEGSYDGEYAITMSQKNIEVLEAVKIFLNDLNFKANIYDYRSSEHNMCILRITGGKKYRKRFFEEIDPIIRNPLK